MVLDILRLEEDILRLEEANLQLEEDNPPGLVPRKRWWRQKMSVSRVFMRLRSSGLREEIVPDCKFHNPPYIKLSAHTETGHAESTIIPVLTQQYFTGKWVIPSSLANTPCADLGLDGVLEKLNTMLGTSYTLDSVISVLHSFVAQGLDFGAAYAYLRPYWDDVHAIKHNLCTGESDDSSMRRRVLVHGRIVDADVPPRRVWDLYANRVVPYWLARGRVWGISHAWVDGKDRVNVMTPINGYEWPVPMPRDANLDLIRIEMLNSMWSYKAEYAWLDVLCLRQEGGQIEHLRLEEWKLDVPTIGSVYTRNAPVVCYFNGLGLPLHLTSDDFESDRCWFRRAWTLQEITNDLTIGGTTRNAFMGNMAKRRFDEQLRSLRHIRQRRTTSTTLDILSEMQNRVSTNPLDKVAGLVYLLCTDSIPIYNTEQSEADAWEVLVDAMTSVCRAELFFYYPEPGTGNKCWRPSWQQVMKTRVIAPSSSWPEEVSRTEDTDTDWYEGYRIEFAYVWGLAEVPKEDIPREGELHFEDSTFKPHTVRVVAHHTYPIPDGLYTLIGCNLEFSSDIWVVGRLRDDGMFEKLSVFSSAESGQVKLGQLALEKRLTTFLC